jgi:hypothetical protein
MAWESESHLHNYLLLISFLSGQVRVTESEASIRALHTRRQISNTGRQVPYLQPQNSLARDVGARGRRGRSTPTRRRKVKPEQVNKSRRSRHSTQQQKESLKKEREGKATQRVECRIQKGGY